VSEDFSYAFFHNAVSRLFLIFGISSSLKEQSVKEQPCVNIGGRVLVLRRVSELVRHFTSRKLNIRASSNKKKADGLQN
jgi:hypothetical protein